MAVATEEPPPPRQLHPELPVEFSYLVMKLLAKKPEERVGSAAEVVEAIDAIERGTSPIIAVQRTPLRRWLTTAAVIAGIAVVAGLAALWIIIADKLTPDSPGVARVENTVTDAKQKPPAKSEFPPTAPASPVPKALLPIARFGHDRGRVRCAQVSPDGKRILTGGMDRELRLWDLASQRLIETMKEESAEVISAVAFTTDGQRILTCRGAIQKEGRPVPGKDHRLSLWDVGTGKLLTRFPGSQEDVWTIAVAPDGRSAVSGGMERRLRLWDLAEGSNTGSIMTHDERAWCLAYSPDGKHLFSAGTGGMIHQWDTSTWQEVRALHGHTALVRCLAVSQDGQWLASGGLDQSVRLWNIPDGKAGGKLEGSESGIVSVAWSPKSDRVLTLSGIEARPLGGWEFAQRDYVMRLYDSQSEKLLALYNIGRAVPVDISFLPHGQAVLVRGDGSIQLFELPP
jgi:WD40 repeat protein